MGEEGAEGNVVFFFSICSLLTYFKSNFIKVSNKEFCCVVRGKCLVMFCPLKLLQNFRSSKAAGEQSACKCDLVYFPLVPGVNNNQWPELDVSYMLYTYVICLIVL